MWGLPGGATECVNLGSPDTPSHNLVAGSHHRVVSSREEEPPRPLPLRSDMSPGFPRSGGGGGEGWKKRKGGRERARVGRRWGGGIKTKASSPHSASFSEEATQNPSLKEPKICRGLQCFHTASQREQAGCSLPQGWPAILEAPEHLGDRPPSA